VEYPLPAALATIDKQTHLVLTGVDRQLIGQTAANMRPEKPDPYKQKGIRAADERLREAGKAGGK
jgi:large subunit ribosomal protein L6